MLKIMVKSEEIRMSEFSFENQGNNTYLVYEVLDERKIDQLALGMLSNNTIENLAAMVYTQQNLRRYIKYNVTAKISVQDILNGMIDRRHLTNMLYGILSAVSDAEEYMLDINTLLFEFDKIFVDVSTGSTVMICLPIVGENRKMPDLKMFFKELLFSAQLNPNEQNDYFVSIINYLNGASIFSVNEFKQLLSGIMNGSKVADTKNVEQKAVRTEKPRAKEARTTVMPQMPKSTVSTPQTSVPHTPQRPNVPSVPNVPNIPNIPNVPNIPNAPIPQGMQGNRSGEQSEEKEISWFYLMRHYNKENAALYKMQKEMKKGQDKKEDSKEAKKGAKKESKKEKKEKKDKKGKTAAVPQGGAFAVPGGMAVPNILSERYPDTYCGDADTESAGCVFRTYFRFIYQSSAGRVFAWESKFWRDDGFKQWRRNGRDNGIISRHASGTDTAETISAPAEK